MSDQKALQGSKTEMRELLEGMKEDINLPSKQINDFFTKKKNLSQWPYLQHIIMNRDLLISYIPSANIPLLKWTVKKRRRKKIRQTIGHESTGLSIEGLITNQVLFCLLFVEIIIMPGEHQ